MPSHFHAIVWIDHSQAKIFHVGLSGEDEIVMHPHLPTRHLHHKANTIGSGNAPLDTAFMADAMNGVSDAGEILIIGPSTARTELAKYIREQRPDIGERIVAVEAADHPSDHQIIAHAKQYFKLGSARISTARG